MSIIDKAIFKAIEAWPYYARGFAAMTPIKEDRVPTCGVDKYWRLYWNEDFLRSVRDNAHLVILHELEHLLREHDARRKERDPMLFNVACDLEINDDIEGIGNVSEDVMLPSKFELKDGELAEWYYNNLPQDAQGQGGEGSGAGGAAEAWEVGKEGEHAESAIEEASAEALRDNIANDIIAAKKRGEEVGPHAALWAEARCKGRLPQTSWRRVVKNRLKEIRHGATDYTFAKVSRRQNRGDRVLLPASVGYKPRVACVVDTSGSMHNEADRVAGILRSLTKMDAKVDVIDCDMEVTGQRVLKHWKDVLKSKGGGGTDMRIGIDHAKGYDMIFCVTDGYTPWPEPWPKNLVGVILDGEKTRIMANAKGD
jgi:predicted metal-dependent peptidase